MIQRFIELGTGYSDIYELLELAKTNAHRIHRVIRFDTSIAQRRVVSFGVVLDPIADSKFMPIYFCREGIPHPEEISNKRCELVDECLKALDLELHILEVKPSTDFHEQDLYYQYLIGVLRMNRFIPPLS
ncbi:methylthioribose kinase [Halalkalibacterium halodurans]|uniref:DUF7147 family protein n=1 Tax=Halalkalibacterium halodurans TaxID=86665 RepID=UPI00106890CE|nr:methylthioribose kinase [Halalkalibacterium halodurans]MED3647266.1 methylthioribose kinase [Halalkalibacterium halodurans]TES53870.1 methylthioribose kinase [Halalkalibacterium halodurans]